MGADEKHAATYHGVRHDPDLNLVRAVYAGASPVPSYDERAEAFNRMVTKVRAEAKAEAYKDAERILHEEARWQLDLHQRHKEYRCKHCSERMTEMENCMTVRANQYKENQ